MTRSLCLLALAFVCTLLCIACEKKNESQKNTFTDTRDGKIYKITKIGEQVWMAENLNYEAEGNRCYNDSTAYCGKYGRLYNWKTAMKVCPSGWHLPTNKELDLLMATVGGKKTAGKYLKATNGWNDYGKISGNGEDKFGFSAMPGGGGNSDGIFGDVGNYGGWWNNVSGYDSDSTYYRGIFCFSKDVGYGNYDEYLLFSVRCLQD